MNSHLGHAMTDLTETSTSRFLHVTEHSLDMQLHHDAGGGPVVVMLHGGGPGASGWSNYYRNVGTFVDAGFRVLPLDCPGFGLSDPIVTAESRDDLHAIAVAA